MVIPLFANQDLTPMLIRSGKYCAFKDSQESVRNSYPLFLFPVRRRSASFGLESLPFRGREFSLEYPR